jgi:hypothetical protein
MPHDQVADEIALMQYANDITTPPTGGSQTLHEGMTQGAADNISAGYQALGRRARSR